jgi:hypothetical protein
VGAVDHVIGHPLALLVGMLLDQHMRQRSSGTVAEETATFPSLC